MNEISLGEYGKAVGERLKAWEESNFTRRLWARDPSLWSEESVPELADRLGWLSLPEASRALLGGIQDFVEEIREEGIKHVLLLGMGGSSLAPDVFRRTFGSAEGYPELLILDSSHPGAVREAEMSLDAGKTLFIVASKSGRTLEPLALFKHFWAKTEEKISDAGSRFVAITDPGTALEGLAREQPFRRVFLSPPDLGGRYSALAVYGLVPAALIGIDIRELLDRARQAAEACVFGASEGGMSGLSLGAALGELALARRNKVTFLATQSAAHFPIWLEQLIAESTGKDGKGIVPVVGEPLASTWCYGPDRFFVLFTVDGDDAAELEEALRRLREAGHPTAVIRLSEKAEIGREIFRWEVAVAAAGSVLGIHPFNQPDVELSKDLARKAMAGGGLAEGEETYVSDEDLRDSLDRWLSQCRAGDYISLHAYLSPSEEVDHGLSNIRQILLDGTCCATTVGYGPRFLHSTGQLHKGGENTGLFLQIVDKPRESVPVPGEEYTFGDIISAQSLGDFRALQQSDRRVLRVNLEEEGVRGLDAIARCLEGDGGMRCARE